MSIRGGNPYAPPTPNTVDRVASRKFLWMRSIFYFHLGATIASAVVVRSTIILSDRLLEMLIALPLISTMIICPIAMLAVTLASRQPTKLLRGSAVGSALALSVIQWFTWLPTFR